MKSTKIIIFLIALCCTMLSCKKNNDSSFTEEKEKILQLHNLQRAYHFNKDSVAFTNQLADSFISVNRGKLNRPTKEENIARLHQYFSSVDFVKWDDVAEPIVKFSDDGSMAYTIVDKIVEVTFKDENGNEKNSSTHFIWTTIYKKYGDEWLIETVTSTNEPAEE
ncbi:MAG: nuclear transport factor 2 family protein [Flavobacteriaceae bacterium]|nr:nuclear transport factor 2 family protein [Flavobacteriaceae bacterium]